MSISFVASNTADFTATHSAVVTAPAGVAQYDLLLVHIFSPWPTASNPLNAADFFLTAPTDDWWIVHMGGLGNLYPALSVVLAKVAGASEPGTYTFTLASDIPANTATGSIGISAWRSSDHTAPIMVQGVTALHDTASSPSLTFNAVDLPVTNAMSVLLSACHWTLTGGHSIGAITQPASSTSRYTRNQSASNWGTIACSSRAVSSGSTAAYAYTATTNPDSSLELYGHVVVLRDTADQQGGTWTRILASQQFAVNEAPSLFFQNDAPSSLYTVNLGLDPDTGDDLFTVDRLTTVDQAVAASFSFIDAVTEYTTVIQAAAINVIDCDCPDHNLYWSTYTTTSSDASYVFRYDTATLSNQQQSPDLGDAPRAIRVGRKGTWSENTVFVTHYGLGSISTAQLMFRFLDKTTLAITRTITMGSFFSAGELVGFPTVEFFNLDTDGSGDVWLAVGYQVPAAAGKFYLFHIGSTGSVTRYDLSATFNPGVSASVNATRLAVGYDKKSGYLLVSDQHQYNWNGDAPLTALTVLFDPVGHTVVASYTPSYAGLTGPVESYPGFTSDGGNSSSAAMWIPYGGVIGSTVSNGGAEYTYLVKLALPGLTQSRVITLPPGYARIIDAVLDLSVSPNRLWVWLSRFPYNTALPALTGGFTYTNQQGSAATQIGSELWTLTLSDETASYTGTPCGSTPVLTCWTLTQGSPDRVTLTGTGLAGVTSVIVSPSNNPYDGGAYHAPIISVSSTQVVVSIPTSSLVWGYFFATTSDGTRTLGLNTPCVAPQLGSQTAWKTRKVWYASLEP